MDVPRKPSLFKLKIKQARLGYSKYDKGMPVAVNIMNLPEDSTNSMENAGQAVKDRQGEMDSKMERTCWEKYMEILPKEYMLKIHEENWTAISKMTEAEREEHVRMINSQLPKTFVSKMRKTVNESVEKSLPQQPQQLQKLPKPVYPYPHQPSITLFEYLYQLTLHIKKNYLFFNFGTIDIQSNTEGDTVSLKLIKQMIECYNNQSQVISAYLLSRLLKQIYTLKTAKHRYLIKIQGITLHIKMIVQELFENIVVILMQLVRVTRFRSIFMYLLTQLTNIVVLCANEFANKYRQIVLKFFEYIKNKVITHERDYETKAAILAPINDIIDHYADIESESIFYFDETLSSIEDIVELMKLEYSISKQYSFVKYLDRIMETLTKHNNEKQTIEFMYYLVRVIRTMKRENTMGSLERIIIHLFEGLNINGYLDIQAKATSNSLYAKRMLLNTLFILKHLNHYSFKYALIDLSTSTKLPEWVHNALIYETLEDYPASNITINEIEDINKMFKWLLDYGSKLIPHYYIFANMVGLFKMYYYIYSLLEQKDIVAVLTLICANIDLSKNVRLVSEYYVKALVRNYNFNSFGNDAFTKLMLFIAVSSAESVYRMILEEVIQRYPFLFYYAYEDNQNVFGLSGMYCCQGRNKELKMEVRKMLESGYAIHNLENRFMLYLRN